MPTPFTHLEIAQRLLQDAHISDDLRALLMEHRPAFLLGNVAADARIAPDVGRENTHFYRYNDEITQHPWRIMLEQHRSLKQSHSPAQRVFLAGYVAHLAADEYWMLHMVRPHFVRKDWPDAPKYARYVGLHLILIHMDRRDAARLADWQAGSLLSAQPNHWLPFMPDDILCGWRDMIGEQIAPGGESKTLDIFGQRIMMKPADILAIVESESEMQTRLWDYVSPADLKAIEDPMYVFCREQMTHYLAKFK